MLYIGDKVAKLGGKILGGEVTSVEIQESASLYTAQDDKGRTKKTQAVGYENSKVVITMILESTKKKSSLKQMKEIEALFRKHGQKKPKMMRIVNEDCSARGIKKVYFKDFTTKKVISESKRVATLELLVPGTASTTVSKKSKKSSKSKKSGGKSSSNSKSKKSTSKSPAKDTRSTSKGKKSARNLTKK